MDLKKLKPFHQSIIDALNNCEHLVEINVILGLLETTQVPKKQKEIIDVLTEKDKQFPKSHKLGESEGPFHVRIALVIDLLKQQQVTAAMAESK